MNVPQLITGFSSREGEEVVFAQPVSTVEHPRINEWLEEVESSMRITLAKFLFSAVSDNKELKAASDSGMDEEKFLAWCDKFPAQIVVLAASVSWTEEVESCFAGGEVAAAEKGLQRMIETIDSLLGMLSKLVLLEQPPIRRKKLEHLMYEYVHRRSVTRGLVARRISSNKAFEWLSQMRFYFDPRQADVLRQLSIHMADTRFHYGFEYLGVQGCDSLDFWELWDKFRDSFRGSFRDKFGTSIIYGMWQNFRYN